MMISGLRQHDILECDRWQRLGVRVFTLAIFFSSVICLHTYDDRTVSEFHAEKPTLNAVVRNIWLQEYDMIYGLRIIKSKQFKVKINNSPVEISLRCEKLSQTNLVIPFWYKCGRRNTWTIQ